MVIDEKRLFTPHRATKNKLTYTDHLSFYMKFKGIPEKMRSYQRAGNAVRWNTNKENGWKVYSDLTTNSKTLDELVLNSTSLNSNELMERITSLMNKMKFQSFGKVKVSNGVSRNKELDEVYRLRANPIDKDDEAERQ